MGAYTDKLKIINKEIDELLFLLKLCIDKKTRIEDLLEQLSILDNDINNNLKNEVFIFIL